MNKKKRLFWIGILMATLLVGFVAGQRVQLWADTTLPGRTLASLLAAVGPEDREPILADDISITPLVTFQEVLKHLRSQYYKKIDQEAQIALTQGAIKGMLVGLDDPYTRFLEPADYREFQLENEGHFSGIGARLSMKEVKLKGKIPGGSPYVYCPVCGAKVTDPERHRPVIVSPLPNSPAQKAGVKPGDIILKVDDHSTAGMTLQEVVKLIRGQKGTKVTLLLLREKEQEPVKAEITRGDIEVASVEFKVLPDKIGYLKLNLFNEQTMSGWNEALAEFKQAGVRGLLLDLRHCPGGLLPVCRQVTSMFVKEGPVVYIQQRKEDATPLNTMPNSPRLSYPVVVLVDEGSASASEILAGAIKDYGIGKLVGAKTFGKGRVQTIIPLSDGSAVSITTARYLTPKEQTDIQDKGIEPDQVVKLPEGAELMSKDDAQAQAAIKLLKQQLAAKAA